MALDGADQKSTRLQSQVSAFHITLAASFHYFGYEFVRASSTSLFTGHYHTSWLPLALCLVPVAVLGLLAVYRHLLHRCGPHFTIVATTLGCVGFLVALYASLVITTGEEGSSVSTARGVTIFALFIFRQAYITFIVSQHWSRLTSCLKLQDATGMFGPIMGVTSLFSVLGGVCVRPVVYEAGEAGLVMVGAVSLTVSAVFSHLAYRAYVSDDDKARGHGSGHAVRPAVATSASEEASTGLGIVAGTPLVRGAGARSAVSSPGSPGPRARRGTGGSPTVVGSGGERGEKGHGSAPATASGLWNLMGLSSLSASPILPPMFMCTVAMQSLATFVTLGFNSYLTEAYVARFRPMAPLHTPCPSDCRYPEAAARATFTGNFFAVINFVSGAFQFCGVRMAFRALPLSAILLAMPCGVMLAALFLVTKPGLAFAALLLFTFKVTEYSLFAAAKELMYLPLDYEARYMAKEVVDVFGYRLGKGGTSLMLAMLLPVMTLQATSYAVLAAAGSCVWLVSTLRLRQAFLTDAARREREQAKDAEKPAVLGERTDSCTPGAVGL